MLAYEFNSIVDDNVIMIPEKYCGLIRSNMRVIVIEKTKMESKKVPTFSALQLKTKGVKFDREIANER